MGFIRTSFNWDCLSTYFVGRILPLAKHTEHTEALLAQRTRSNACVNTSLSAQRTLRNRTSGWQRKLLTRERESRKKEKVRGGLGQTRVSTWVWTLDRHCGTERAVYNENCWQENENRETNSMREEDWWVHCLTRRVCFSFIVDDVVNGAQWTTA